MGKYSQSPSRRIAHLKLAHANKARAEVDGLCTRCLVYKPMIGKRRCRRCIESQAEYRKDKNIHYKLNKHLR